MQPAREVLVKVSEGTAQEASRKRAGRFSSEHARMTRKKVAEQDLFKYMTNMHKPHGFDDPKIQLWHRAPQVLVTLNKGRYHVAGHDPVPNFALLAQLLRAQVQVERIADRDGA